MGFFKKLGRGIKHGFKKATHGVKKVGKGIVKSTVGVVPFHKKIGKLVKGTTKLAAGAVHGATKLTGDVFHAADNITTGVGGLFKNTGMLVYGAMAVGGLYFGSKILRG